MWPFTKKPDAPDNRPPSAAVRAIAASLVNEPQRWSLGRSDSLLVHDSQTVIINTFENWIQQPWIEDEPDANQGVLADAIDKWLALTVTAPKPVVATAPAPNDEQGAP